MTVGNASLAALFEYPGEYEPDQLAHFEGLLTNARRFVDVGANRGIYSYVANSVIHSGKIVLVEANPVLVEKLYARIESWPHDTGNSIDIFEAAVSDRAGEIPFSIGTKDTHGTAARKSGAANLETILVQARKLDDIVAPMSGTVFKVDVEGFEYRVVSGAVQNLAANDCTFLIEMHGWGDEVLGKYPFHVFAFLWRLQYVPRRVGNSHTYEFSKASPVVCLAGFLRYGSIMFVKYLLRRSGLRLILKPNSQ